MNSIDIDKYNLHVVDVIDLISSVEYQVLRDLDQYGVTPPFNYRTKIIKTVFYFYTLKKICDVVIDCDARNKCVFFYNEDCMDQYDLTLHKKQGSHTFVSFVKTFLRHMNSILPLLFYITNDVCFNELNDKSGDSQDILLDMSSTRVNKANKSFTFERSKKFVKTYGLTYLDKEYFDKVKVKALLYK